MRSTNIAYLWSVMPSLHLPVPQGFLTFTCGFLGSAGVRDNMARTCRYSRTEV